MNQSFQASARPATHGTSPRVAVVSSGWHKSIIDNALQSIRDEFARSASDIRLDFFDVPGAFEIPLHAQKLCQSGNYDAVIACGFVVDGGIYRHEFVASAVIDGLMQVQLQTGVPIFSAVLTPKSFHENEDHLRFFSAHFIGKGTEVARACIETLASLASLAKLPEVAA
jgi:6,7-dimethyl-8-ribityllumazine synthase